MNTSVVKRQSESLLWPRLMEAGGDNNDGLDLEALRQKSREHFSSERFEHLPDVVVFAEHRTQLRDGQPVEYSPEVLRRIAACCNRRIARTGNWAAVCIGHTNPQQGPKPLIGFAGPFWVTDDDGWAVIKADLWIFKDQVDQLERFPRPSPEVWIPTEGFAPDRIFLDPIAFLGADAPRLDLGMTFLYQAQDGQYLCEKYAAVFPAAGNVSVPSWNAKKQKTSYQKGPSNMALSPEDIQAILKAIEATDWYKWIREQMAASTKPQEDQSGETPPEAQDGSKETYKTEDENEKEKPQEVPPPTEKPEKEKPKEVEEYRCKTTYSREAEMQMQKELYQLRQELERERALRVNTQRRRQLEQLARHFALDIEEEMQLCQYGRMDAPTFEKHLERIEKYYRQIPADAVFPGFGEADSHWAGPPMSKDVYQRQQREELSKKAAELARKLANRGQWISFEEALERVQRGET